MHAVLWPAVRQELIERLEGSYKFIHDRVQEAAYSLIPEALRAEVHLRIGRLLVTETPADNREEAIFEILNQLNRGTPVAPTRGTGPTRRAQSARWQTRQGSYCLCLGARLSHRRWGVIEGRLLGAEASADLCAGVEPRRMRIFDRPVVGRRGAIGCIVESRRDNGRTSNPRKLAHECLYGPP